MRRILIYDGYRNLGKSGCGLAVFSLMGMGVVDFQLILNVGAE
jgi:hypothetical protein